MAEPVLSRDPEHLPDSLPRGGQLPADLAPLADGILMDHQKSWLDDKSDLKVCEKGRRAVASGTSLEEFRRDFRGIVEDRGWHGWTGEGTRAGEAWRTRVIYRRTCAPATWPAVSPSSARRSIPSSSTGTADRPIPASGTSPGTVLCCRPIIRSGRRTFRRTAGAAAATCSARGLVKALRSGDQLFVTSFRRLSGAPEERRRVLDRLRRRNT